MNGDLQQQQQLAYGNAQAYLQQQHAALQQQQALLQQQQAALALQQQQLQAYGINPGLLNANGAVNANGSNFNGMNQYGQTGGGYYYVASADGTPMMVPNQQGVAQQGMANAYGMPQQHDQYGGSYQNNFADGSQGFNPPNPAANYGGGMSM